MDILRAKELLEGLADGVNPLTGEVLSADDSCNQAEIVRAIYVVLRHLEETSETNEKSLPSNAGKPWSAEDDSKLSELYLAGTTMKEIQDYFQRTRGSISSRLVKLGLKEKSQRNNIPF